MEMVQISQLVNTIAKNALADNPTPVMEDLSNVVPVGQAIIGAIGYDNFTKELVDRIGRVVFTERAYDDDSLGIRKDSWTYGSIMEKISMDLSEAQDNPAWDLQDGDVVEQDAVVVPKTKVKFFNKDGTFEIPYTITDTQMESSFSNAQQLGSFVSMIELTARKAMNIRTRQYERRAINNLMGLTIKNESMDTGASGKTGVKVVNLLYKYKQTPIGTKDTGITAQNCIFNPDFIRFAVSELDMYIKRMGSLTRLFNIDKMARYTPRNLLHFVVLDEFESKTKVYLQSDTFHNELVSLPYGRTIPFWQGTGDDFSFDNCSTINIKTSAGDTINMSGVIATMFDDEALAINREFMKTTTHRNEHGEYANFWAKYRARLFNDTQEQMVVFIVA